MFTKARKQLPLWSGLCVLIILMLFAQSVSPAFAANETVTINMASTSGAPTYAASGFIYGIAPDGSQPPQNILTDIKVRNMRAGGSQQGCPNGGYVNGAYAARWNVVKAYWSKAHAIGARYQVILAGVWGADAACNVPRWPGDNGDWTEYNNMVNQLLNDVVANGMTGSDLLWDVWNEPDGPYFWGRTQAQYFEMWKRGVQLIRARIPSAVIVGPSGVCSPNSTWYGQFLDYAKSNSVLPNILSWHSCNDPVIEASDANTALSARGITGLTYNVNEYSSSGNEQQPGHSAWMYARFERAGIAGAARSNWGGGAALYQTMGALVTSSWQPMGAWWVYKRYADETGLRTSITASTSVDGVVSQDSAAVKSIAVLGKRNGSGTGNVAVVYQNIPSWLQNAGAVTVLVERMPSGSTYVAAPTVVSNSSMAVSGNSITVNINWSNALDAYAITLTPGGGGGPTSTPPPTPTSGQYEAENGSWGGGAAIATDHTGYTGTGFVGFLTAQGSYSQFTVTVASAGNYSVPLRYSAGPNGPATDRTMHIYVNGAVVKQTVMTRTTDWNTWATKTETLALIAGNNTIKYQFDSGDTGYINADNILVSGGSAPTATPTKTNTPVGPTPTKTNTPVPPTVGPTPTTGAFPVPGTYYRLINRNSGKVAEVANFSTADGGNVQQWTSTGTTSQQWSFVSVGGGYYNVINRNSGKCLDVNGASTADGANVQQWTCGSGTNQRWQLIAVGSYYELKAQHSGKVLDVVGNGAADGVNIDQWTWNSGNNQQWQIIP